MTKQKRNPKRAVVMAAVFAILAVVAFAAVFWYYDGVSVVEDVLGFSLTGGGDQTSNGDATVEPAPDESGESTESAESTDSPAGGESGEGTSPSGLKLPEGMPEEFALRMYQEQLDSQSSIGRMANGEIDRIVITDVQNDGEESRLSLTAHLARGGSADGVINMRRLGGNWFFSNLSGIGGEGPDEESAVPDVADVDTALVNAMIEEQVKSAAVLEEYATGVVEEVRFDEITDGPGTKTLDIIMNETHEEGYGDVVLISREIDGKTVWFITRFTKE